MIYSLRKTIDVYHLKNSKMSALSKNKVIIDSLRKSKIKVNVVAIEDFLYL